MRKKILFSLLYFYGVVWSVLIGSLVRNLPAVVMMQRSSMGGGRVLGVKKAIGRVITAIALSSTWPRCVH
ncbi:hypothetical protein ME7_01377 [Bartonella birtlesii LL-WM9]|uniref:Uncharacterized protein n=1 Tax=Bartonella birtlesii LL-WM9 TaxID=1094552 RepID=J0PRA7_9HYPH|nr:hypothetical protein [Bartonella birtlesii]EJF75006.1 hypothetical protein ME7_01377 [Bartonella birtlesii LL-WM9]